MKKNVLSGKQYFTFRLFLMMVSTTGILMLNSCGEERENARYEERCYCPMEDVKGLANVTDSTFSNDRNSHEFDAGISVGLPEQVLKYLNVELSTGYSYQDEEELVRKVVSKTTNAFPKIGNYQLVMGSMHCAMIWSRCRDTIISDRELFDFKNKLLVELTSQLHELMLEDIHGTNSINFAPTPIPADPPTAKRPSISVSSGIIDREKIDKLEESLKAYCKPTGKCPSLLVEVTHDIELEPVALSDRTVRFSGGGLRILVNGKACSIVSLGDVSPTAGNISGAESTLKIKRKELLNTYFLNNLETIAQSIQSCF